MTLMAALPRFCLKFFFVYGLAKMGVATLACPFLPILNTKLIYTYIIGQDSSPIRPVLIPRTLPSSHFYCIPTHLNLHMYYMHMYAHYHNDISI